MTDRELLQRYVRDRANDAMDELVRRHAGMVHALAQRELKDASLADDVTQAVFVVLMRRAATLSPRTLLPGWLFKVTRYAVADVRKGRMRREHHEREAARMNADTPPPAAAQVEPHLTTALASLSDADRNAILLRYFENQPAASIARALGTTENTARQRLARAIDRLRKHLQGAGLAINCGALAAALEAAQPRPPHAILAAQLHHLVHGAAPSSTVEPLITGVLHMMQKARLIALTTSVAASLLVLTAGGILLAAANRPALAPPPQAPPAPAAAARIEVPANAVTAASAAPATGRAATTVPADPLATPKGAVLAAFQAACADDVDAFFRAIAHVDDAQRTLLVSVVHSMAAVSDLDQAMIRRFGSAAGPALLKSMATGVDPRDVDKATETIDGDRAIVDIGTSGPGKIPLSRQDGLWRVDASMLGMPNRASVEQIEKLIPTLKQITARVNDGKYATAADVQKDLQQLLSNQASTRPALP